MCDYCPNAFHFGCIGLDVRVRAQTGDWLCSDCRKVDNLARIDERPGKQPRLGAAAPTALPTLNKTCVSQPSTSPVETARPRKVVAFSDAASDILPPIPAPALGSPIPTPAPPAADQLPLLTDSSSASSAAQLLLATVPSSVLPLPRSHATWRSSTAHGAVLTLPSRPCP